MSGTGREAGAKDHGLGVGKVGDGGEEERLVEAAVGEDVGCTCMWRGNLPPAENAAVVSRCM